MLIVLPAISIIIGYYLFFQTNKCWRSAVLSTSVVWGVIVTVITESLSFFHVLNFNFVVFSWLLVNIILASIGFKFYRKNQKWTIKNPILELPKFLNFLLLSVGLIVIAIALIAIVAPPNNWDSMNYHMTRVVHWIQNQSVAHYPTSYTPQLYQNPWSEFAILHWQILSGVDYFANLVQLFSMVGCIVGNSLIAQQLGADLRGQVFTAVVSATIPMGILQASSTQNDYILAFWVVCLAYYVIKTVQHGKQTTWDIYLLLAGSLGLAILTKGTAYFYIFPFLVWLTLSQIRYLRWQVWKPAVIVAIIAICINISHWLRNYNLFGSPLGEPNDYKNEILGINVLISNILRNIALHIGTPIGIINAINYKIIQIIHTFIGIADNDPRTTFLTKNFFVPGTWSTFGFTGNENSAGNFLHILLIFTCIIIFIFKKELRRQSQVTVYLITVLGTFVVFCYLVKWQPWHSRLHLSWFVLTSPCIGLLLSQLDQKRLINYLAVFLILSSLPWVFLNRYRPLIGSNNIFQTSRIEQYFMNRPHLLQPHSQAVEFLKTKQCDYIGLAFENDAWEYPFWIMLQENQGRKFQLQHINVANKSAIKENLYPYIDFEPCSVIYIKPRQNKQDNRQEIKFEDQTFVKEWDSQYVAVFLEK